MMLADRRVVPLVFAALSGCGSDGAADAPGGAGGTTLPGGSAATSGGAGPTGNGGSSSPAGGTAASGMGPGGVAGTFNVGGTTGGAAGGADTAGASGSLATGGAMGSGGASSTESSAALAALEAHLAMPRAARPELATLDFATVALTRDDAERAAELLWDDFAEHVRTTRAGEVGATESVAASFQVDGDTLRYYRAVRGTEPPGGRSLFISMHGGGNAPAATNDQQWENQIDLVDGYDPQDAVWIAPRAPSNDWNMWFTPNIEPLFEHLITNMVVFDGINPNKVYLTGYSAGGDGVYQLGPRMADSWAGAAMSAGHPNDASPLNLRNVAFAIHVGGNDTAYERNAKGAEWGGLLENLADEDAAGGYPNQWEVHAGLPHWMNLADAVAIPFLQMHTREPAPSKVVWRQANVTHSRFYWLAVDPADERTGTEVTATVSASTIVLSDVSDLGRLTIRISDALMDMDSPVRVEMEGREVFSGRVNRTIAVIDETLAERGDPGLVYFGEVTVQLE